MISGSRRSDQAFQQALALHQQGMLDRAVAMYEDILQKDNEHAEALNLLGVARAQLGHVEEGILSLRAALAIEPTNPHFLNNLGRVLKDAGHLVEAEEAFRVAVEHGREMPVPLFNLGHVLRDQGKTEAARAVYEQAAASFPSHPEGPYNLACLTLSAGKPTEALPLFIKLVETFPEFAPAHNNVGTLYHEVNDLEQAERAFRAALKFDPKMPSALHNLGAILRDTGRMEEALATLWQAVQIHPDQNTWNTFVHLFRRARLETEGQSIEWMPVVNACLSHDTLDSQELAAVAISALRHHPAVAELFQIANLENREEFRLKIQAHAGWKVFGQTTFQLLMERVIVPAIDYEWLLTELRWYLLEQLVDDKPITVEHLTIAARLSQQCYLNGYVFRTLEWETKTVQRLLEEGESGDLPEEDLRRAFQFAILSCYEPFTTRPHADEALKLSERLGNKAFLGLMSRQIVEPTTEQSLLARIPSMGTIKSEVSRRVQEMYEEHPYPRWLYLDHEPSRTVADVMRGMFPDVALPKVEQYDQPTILIAGCGTGRQLLRTKRRFSNSSALGLDLSASSLAYALRKSQEYGEENIKLLQCDILSVPSMRETFHIVECTGVLHHMEDPIAAWEMLTARVRPHGLMKIGLYSELARKEIVEARRLIYEWDLRPDADGIRTARQRLMPTLREKDVSMVLRSKDFYSMHECRDLLCHVQEHRFTLPQIQEALDKLKLEFIGFEHADASVAERFRQLHPEPGAERSLELWATFEQAHPLTFVGMYQFWVRKPGK